MSVKRAVAVRTALDELWQLNPGSYAYPANICDIRQHPALLRLREVYRNAYANSGVRSPDHALVNALRSLGIRGASMPGPCSALG